MWKTYVPIWNFGWFLLLNYKGTIRHNSFWKFLLGMKENLRGIYDYRSDGVVFMYWLIIYLYMIKNSLDTVALNYRLVIVIIRIKLLIKKLLNEFYQSFLSTTSEWKIINYIIPFVPKWFRFLNLNTFIIIWNNDYSHVRYK